MIYLIDYWDYHPIHTQNTECDDVLSFSLNYIVLPKAESASLEPVENGPKKLSGALVLWKLFGYIEITI